MTSLKNVVFRSLLIILILAGTACSTMYWQKVKEPTLVTHSKVAMNGGFQRLHFVIANPTSDTKYYSVSCNDRDFDLGGVDSPITKVGPYSDEMLSVVYSQQSFSRTIRCWLLEEDMPEEN